MEEKKAARFKMEYNRFVGKRLIPTAKPPHTYTGGSTGNILALVKPCFWFIRDWSRWLRDHGVYDTSILRDVLESHWGNIAAPASRLRPLDASR